MEAIATYLDITPSRPLSPASHGPRDLPSRKVALPFEANVLGLRENGQTLIVVSVDWFFASPGLRERILSRCAGRLDDAGLVVAASHAHTSPNPDRTKKVHFSKVDHEYVAWAEEAIAVRIDEILRNGKWHRARLRFATTACDCAIHRRREIWSAGRSGLRREISIFPNDAGPRDRELRLLRVEGQDGGLLAVMWGVSCHPTDWPRYRELSSDYPGGVRRALRARAGAEVPVVFLQGFCGTLRPRAIGRWPRRGNWRVRAHALASVLLNGPTFVGFTVREYTKWMDGIAECAAKALEQAARIPALDTKLSIRRSSIELTALGLSGEPDKLTFHSFELGGNLRVVGISAEVCWEYADLLKRALAGKTVWPVGYIDSVYGYLPTRAMVAEGGYEVSGFFQWGGVKGKFVDDIDEIIVRSLS